MFGSSEGYYDETDGAWAVTGLTSLAVGVSSRRLPKGAARKGHACATITVAEFAYYCGFVALCLWQGFATTNFESVLGMSMSTFGTMMQIVCVSCLALKMIVEPVDFRRGFVAVVLGALLAVSYLQCKTNVLLVTFVFIVFGKGISFKRLAKIAFAVYSFLFLITVVCALTGQIDVVMKVRDDGQLRSSMGFTHPNRFSTTLFQILVAWLVIRYPRFGVSELGACAVAIALSLTVADSRTTALAVIAMAVLIFIAVRLEKKGKARKFVVIAGVIVFVLIAASIYFMVSYDRGNLLHLQLNDALSGRLFLAHGYYDTFPPKLFGQFFSTDIYYRFVAGGGSSGLLVDNTYARVFILYGVVPAVIFFTGLALLFKREFCRGHVRPEFLFLVVFLIVGFAESFVLNLSMDFTLIAFNAVFTESPAETCVGQARRRHDG